MQYDHVIHDLVHIIIVMLLTNNNNLITAINVCHYSMINQPVIVHDKSVAGRQYFRDLQITANDVTNSEMNLFSTGKEKFSLKNYFANIS